MEKCNMCQQKTLKYSWRQLRRTLSIRILQKCLSKNWIEICEKNLISVLKSQSGILLEMCVAHASKIIYIFCWKNCQICHLQNEIEFRFCVITFVFFLFYISMTWKFPCWICWHFKNRIFHFSISFYHIIISRFINFF